MPGTGHDLPEVGAHSRHSSQTGDLEHQQIEREQHIHDLEQQILASFEQLQTKLSQRYGSPLCGRNRAVFIDAEKNIVYKVPRNFDGIEDSSCEAAHKDPGIPLATCEIITIDDVPVLQMERVTPYTGPWNQLPEWTGWVDGAQVGYTIDGRLVAYDL